MVADEGKKVKLSAAEKVEEEEENSELLDGELVLSIEQLQEIQEELEKINEEASEKVLKIEQTYNDIRRPVYDQRREVIEKIPDFWLTAFLSHPALGELLTEEDQKMFKYLKSLEVEDFRDVKSGYFISFVFNPNPYFEDKKLTKSFTFLEDGTTKVSATPIKWKEGAGLANGVAHEKKGNKRPFTEESFFHWFSDTQEKDNIDDFNDEIAELIKEDLWPNPLNYFSNEADEEDGVEDYEEGKEGQGSAEDDDGEDSDEDGDDEDDN